MAKKSKFSDYENLDENLNDDLDENLNDNFNNIKNEDEEDNDSDEISLEKENEIIKILDDDLIKYFGEAKIINKRKLNNNFKKNKRKDFIVGQKIKINNMSGKILFGPYEIGNKLMYEIELENGNIISEDMSKIE